MAKLKSWFCIIGLFLLVVSIAGWWGFFDPNDADYQDMDILKVALGMSVLGFVSLVGGLLMPAGRERREPERTPAAPAPVVFVRHERRAPESSPPAPAPAPNIGKYVVWIILAIVGGFIALGLILRI